jgi:uncharacterized protein YciW
LCKFAELLTRTPSAVRPQDLNTLRVHGLTDRDILDVVEVVSYFNYINRVADALGVDPESDMRKAFELWQRQAAEGLTPNRPESLPEGV